MVVGNITKTFYFYNFSSPKLLKHAITFFVTVLFNLFIFFIHSLLNNVFLGVHKKMNAAFPLRKQKNWCFL